VNAEPIAKHCTLDPDIKHDPHATRFGKFLQACIKFEGSDLIVKTGTIPKIRLRGAPVRFSRTRDAERAGIAIIHQELNLVEQLYAAANIFLGREQRTPLGFIDNAAHLGGLAGGFLMGVVLAERFDEEQFRRQAFVRAAAAIGLAALVLGAAWRLLPAPAG
jgi:hypothetical protein